MSGFYLDSVVREFYIILYQCFPYTYKRCTVFVSVLIYITAREILLILDSERL